MPKYTKTRCFMHLSAQSVNMVPRCALLLYTDKGVYCKKKENEI